MMGFFLFRMSQIDKDMENVAKSLLGNIGVSLNIDHGCCMSCRSHIDVSSALATSQREESTIDRYILHNCIWNFKFDYLDFLSSSRNCKFGVSSIPGIVITTALDRLKKLTLLDKTLITEALQSLNLLKKLRHPYSKAHAQVRLLICLCSNSVSKSTCTCVQLYT